MAIIKKAAAQAQLPVAEAVKEKPVFLEVFAGGWPSSKRKDFIAFQVRKDISVQLNEGEYVYVRPNNRQRAGKNDPLFEMGIFPAKQA